MRARVLVLQHHDDDGVGALGDALAAAGVSLDVVRPDLGQALPERPDHDGLIVLGGEMDVWQEDRHPWLADEKVLIRRWTDADRGPLLGICLGHQLLADALGGTVGPRERPEAGVHEVAANPDGAADTMIGPLGSTWPTLQWHGAEVRVPPSGAIVLAANPACAVQAMRVGAQWWGVQFHPEVDADGVAAWSALPGFATALERSDGPGAPEAFADRHAAARPGLDAVTTSLAASVVGLLGQPSVLEDSGPAERASTSGRASSTARSRS